MSESVSKPRAKATHTQCVEIGARWREKILGRGEGTLDARGDKRQLAARARSWRRGRGEIQLYGIVPIVQYSTIQGDIVLVTQEAITHD